MKILKHKKMAFLFAVTLTGCSMASAQEIAPGRVIGSPNVSDIVTVPTHDINQYNLGLFTVVLDQYVKSGQYEQDLATVDTQAQDYLAQRIEENTKSSDPKKLALVLDIDETALSNMATMQKLGYGYNAILFNDAILKSQDTAIEPTLKLYQYAVAHGVSVFFVTGRRVEFEKATEKNLKHVGYQTWQELDLEPDTYHLHSVIPYKSSVRKKIEAEGYDIALNVGDQYSDLEGGYADRGYKLPDPFYYIP